MTDTAPPLEGSPAKPEAKPRWRRRLAIAAQVGLGLALGLALTELAFAKRDQDAFPHVNFYVPDAELGARLEPGASMGFKLGDNPLTRIHVNRQGYRGADWPEPGPELADEILIVGDSQVFGLGVDDGETFSAVLAERTGLPVLNGGVPTYGPPEYAALTEELLEQRNIGTVVYVLNFLNDPFELERPNRERHAIWDGWAVRIETAPGSGDIVEFPGRRWLMSKSHAVYAARRWWHSRDAEWFAQVDRGLPSEGDWTDLLHEPPPPPAVEPEPEPEPEPPSPVASDGDGERITALEQQLARLDRQVEGAQEEFQRQRLSGRDREIIDAKPGGIIRDKYSESARKITVTAELYQRALENRKQHQMALAKRREVERRRDRIASELGELRSGSAAAEPEPEPEPETETEPEPETKAEPVRSVFDDHFAQLQELSIRHDVELVIVLLPFDVQVSRDEWAKYGVADGPDMTPTLALLDDARQSAEHRGITVLDATPALRAAEPGAFLDADIHMTPKGHAALAEALESVLLGYGEVQAKQSKSESKQSKSK